MVLRRRAGSRRSADGFVVQEKVDTDRLKVLDRILERFSLRLTHRIAVIARLDRAIQ
jgi:hypothetical protein